MAKGRSAQSTSRSLGTVALIAFAVGVITLLATAVQAQQSRTRREVVRATMPGVVMIMAVDVNNGKLQPVGSGSGTVLTSNGAVLTNYHVLNDEKAHKLHDLFVIGRFQRPDAEPEFVCAGKPSAGKLKPDLDLALIRCEMDMNGRPHTPSGWPVVPIGRSEDLELGQELLVLGYPDVGGSTIHVTSGKISGWSGEQGGAGRNFIKTEAAITHGNSGGTATDENGEFVGVPTAFRVRQGEGGATVGNVGLIRPVEWARDLIAVANSDWTPKEGDNGVPDALPPTRTPVVSTEVSIHSTVVDAANGEAIRGAFVIVFKPGIHVRDIDPDKLEEQALTWGQTNNRGEFTVISPVPRGNNYTVAVLAKGYVPLAVDDVLDIDAKTPDSYDPWGVIRLERE